MINKQESPSSTSPSQAELESNSKLKIVTDIRAFAEELKLQGIKIFNNDNLIVEAGYFSEEKGELSEDDNLPDTLKYPASLSFDEAKSKEDGVVIMEGDYGGQIYLTCQMKHIKCDEETMNKLLHDLDRIEWGCNDEDEGSSIDYHCVKPGYGVIGGMGGGVVVNGLWIHEDINPTVTAKIQQVLTGEIKSIV